MAKRRSLRERIISMYSANETAGTIYGKFLKGKPYNKQKEAFDIFVDLAKVENENISLRTKALVMLDFFKGMVNSNWCTDCKIVNDYGNIPDIIEQNCSEISNLIKANKLIHFGENTLLDKYITNTVSCANIFKINSTTFLELLDLLKLYYDLEKKDNLKILNRTESYLYGQIKRIEEELKKP